MGHLAQKIRWVFHLSAEGRRIFELLRPSHDKNGWEISAQLRNKVTAFSLKPPAELALGARSDQIGDVEFVNDSATDIFEVAMRLFLVTVHVKCDEECSVLSLLT